MVTLRKRARTSETSVTAEEVQNESNLTAGNGEKRGSGYEQSRDQRIKENMERMQKLGIVDLSLKLKSGISSPKRTRRNTSEGKTPHPSPVHSAEPSRRSSRLQNAAPVNYSEVRMHKKNKSGSLEDEEPWIGEGEKPEIYTEEHEKLLGTCETPWTLFVDGFGEDGKRIYDSINGKTCHQCRQKTLGRRTHCIKCDLVQGQFCGDCLYMRYGENVLEAKQNPNWICPPCRGICNCSLCRLKKGWVPTGNLYRKVMKLGYKSVAHYLIQTRRAQTNLEEESGMKHSSVKSALPCEGSKELSQQKSFVSDDDNQECSEPQLEEFEDDDGTEEKKARVQNMDTEHDVSNSASEGNSKLTINHALPTWTEEKKAEVQNMDTEHDVSNSASEGDSKLTINHALPTEIFQESIAGRQNSKKESDCSKCTAPETGNSQDEKSKVGKEVGNTHYVDISDTGSESDQNPIALAGNLIPNSIAGRLRARQRRS